MTDAALDLCDAREAASAARVLNDRNPIGTPDGTPGDDAPKGRK